MTARMKMTLLIATVLQCAPDLWPMARVALVVPAAFVIVFTPTVRRPP